MPRAVSASPLFAPGGPGDDRGRGSGNGSRGGAGSRLAPHPNSLQSQPTPEASKLIYPEPFHFPQELNLSINRATSPGLLNTSFSSRSANRVQLEFQAYRNWNTNHNAVGRNPAYRPVKDSTYAGLQKTVSAFLGHALHVCRVPPELITFKLVTNPVSVWVNRW